MSSALCAEALEPRRERWLLAMSRGITLLMLVAFLAPASALGELQPASDEAVEATGNPELRERLARLTELSFADLLNVRISVASKRQEPSGDAPSVVAVSSSDEIKVFGDRNLRQTLSRMPGLYTGSSWFLWPQNTVSLRGDQQYQNRHTLLLINGRPARESHDGGKSHPIYLNFPVESLQRVEVIRGPGSVLYGTNAFTGVINLSLKEPPDEPTLQAQVRGGSFGHFDAAVHGGAKAGDFGFYGATRLMRAEGWNYPATDEVGQFRKDDYRQRSYAAVTHMNYRALKLDVFAEYGEDFAFGSAPNWSISPNHKNVNQRVFADLGYPIDLHENWRLDLHGTFNYMSNEFYGPGGKERPLSTDFLGEATLFGKPIRGLNLVFGFLKEYQRSAKTGGAALPAKYSLSPHSAYAQVDYLLTEHLSIPSTKVKLIFGTQWNKPENQDSDFIFRVGTVATFKDDFGLKLLRAEAYRSPSGVEQFLDVPVAVGNPDLGPETITTYDAQLFYRRERTEAALTYFHNTIEDIIISGPGGSGGRFTVINRGQQKFWGLEFEGRHFFSPHFFVSGSVAYQKNKEDDSIVPSTFPKVVGKAAIAYQGARWSPSVSYELSTKPRSLPGADPVNPEPKALHLVTANVECEVSDLLRMERGSAVLIARIENLLDQEIDYPEFWRRNINSLPGGPGVAFYGGLRVGF
jgi:outer membrane receptor protein involved in Fe transport